MKTVKSKDGTLIAYDQKGQGPALILVDGAMCFRKFGPMEPLAEQLTPHFTVITYDRRGRGESGDTPPYTIEREVEDIAALVEAAGGSASLFGASSGAALALIAAASGLNIKKLVMYEPPYVVDNAKFSRPSDYAQRFEDLLAEGRRGDMVEHFMVNGVGMPAEAVVPMKNSPVWPILESIAPTLIYDTAVMELNRWNPPANAASVQVPTLVISGGASPVYMINAAQSTADAIPGAKHISLEGQTHEVNAQVTAPLLVEFLKPLRFRTTLLQEKKTATGIQVPEEVVKTLGKGKRPTVRVTIGDYTYRSAIAPVGGVYMIPVSGENRSAAGITAGDEVDVELELDNQPREATVPPDLALALDQVPDAKQVFEGLSYSGKRRIILGIEGAKTPETRQRRVDKAITDLREGKV